jgi:hypothetical protein
MTTYHLTPVSTHPRSLRSRAAAAICSALVLLVLVACGGGAVTIGDLPVYTDARELKAGESTVADTLKNNMEQDKALRDAIGNGGKTEQRGFKLPADASWPRVKAFYADKLKAQGWNEGAGGIAGNIVSDVMDQVNSSNEMFQTALFSKGNQTLSIVRVVNPVDTTDVELVLSLSSR